MSHIHLPDGLLSPVWWIPGFIITFYIVYLIVKSIDQEKVGQKIPQMVGVAAIMLLGMSVPLFILPVHLSLAVLTSILIGPKLGFLIVLAVNLTLASLGHGGITLVGINTLIFGVEVFVGYCIFRALAKKSKYTIGTMVATLTAIIISMTITVSFIGATGGLTELLSHYLVEHSYQEEDLVLEEEDLLAEEGLFEEEGLFDEERLFEEEELFDEERQLEDERLFDEERLLEEERLFNEERLLEEKQLLEEGRLLEDGDLQEDRRLKDEKHLVEDHHPWDLIKYFELTGWTALLSIFIVGILLETISTTLIIRYAIKVSPEFVASIENKY